ncbi:MAG: CPBP family intramembrane metalloprotease [Gemmatimonadota bacterium]|nr:CPBP family intramembrane metalloprotease [Gemmatimonadota bacterium]
MERRPILDRVLRTREGRLLLGWRLTLFVMLTITVSGVVGLVIPAGLLTGSFALLVGSVTAGVVLLALDGRDPGALGFYTRPGAASETARGVLLGTAIALSLVAVIALTGGVRWSTQDGSLIGWLSGALGALAFLAIPAAAEEALLRGYPLQATAEKWGPVGALALTAAVFGALHLSNPGVTALGTVNVMAAGVLLGIIYLRTASLWWATGAHLGWNWSHGYLADVPVSGLELLDAPLYEGVMQGPAWLGGGGFGPEGGLVATAVVGGASVWCWRSKWLRPSEAAIRARPLAMIEEGGS